MAIEKEVFSDGVYQIHVVDQTVRLDFMRLQPSPEQTAPVPNPFERVILTPQGFLRTLDAMNQIAAKLEEAGYIQRKPNEGDAQK